MLPLLPRMIGGRLKHRCAEPPSRISKSSGFSLLEQAAVLPIFLALLLGAFDATHVIRARTALEAGVRSAIRCSSTTDSPCLKATSRPTKDIFHVYLPPLANDTYAYHGTATWLSVPDYRYSSVSAEVLIRPRYDQPQHSYRAIRPLYHVEADARWIRPLGPVAPDVGETDSNARLFQQVGIPSGFTESNIDFTRGSVGGEADAGETITLGVASFSVPLSKGFDAPCYESTFRGTSCPAGTPSENARLFLNIGGDGSHGGRGTSSADVGNVTLHIRYLAAGTSRWTPWTSLGGRIYSGPGPAHLIPRGFSFNRNDIASESNLEWCRWRDPADPSAPKYRECSLYQRIEVPLGAQVQLRFQLRNLTNRQPVRWTLTRLEGYTRAFAHEVTPLACHGEYSRRRALAGECSWDYPYPPHNTRVLREIRREYSPAKCALPTPDASTIAEGDPADYLLDTEDLGLANCPVVPVNDAQVPPCPENQGVKSPAVWSSADGAGIVREESGAASLCPVPESAKNTRWIVGSREVAHAPFMLSDIDCTNSPDLNRPDNPLRSHIPASLLAYPHLSIGTPEISSRTDRYTGTQDPSELLGTDPRYSCTSVQIASKVYDEHTRDLPPQSLFRAPWSWDLGCAWEGIVRQAALEAGMHAESFFTPARSGPYHRQGYTLGASSIDSCTNLTWDSSLESEGARSLLGTFDAGSLPAQCFVPVGSETQNLCLSLYAGSISTGEPGREEIVAAKARAEGENAIRAYFPKASFDGCQGNYCVSFPDVALDHETFTVSARASMQVPLTILAGYPVVVSFQGHDRWEGAYSR